ncbi:DUF433 domain-containing protein [Neomoorella thermoacetica]|uniref:DUF433 domain-containing protein n=1 Tax=Neomoorella thermoacetica TaxID=1525 RepID=UPI0004B8469D|nr:DUF433 domain-containing protein [Moorella thermoacetica]
MERIVCNPEILGGKPVIKGTRIAVYLILDLISEGYSFEEIIKLYPHLTTEDIKACIRYTSKTEDQAWLKAELGELPPYDWGSEGPPKGKPVRYESGIGLIITGDKQ